jgi:hypothetical protein
VLGILAGAILVYLFYPEIFKISFPASLLVGIKHLKRTKDFLKGKRV